MSVGAGFLSYVLGQLAGLGEVVSRRMFGGVGLYADGLFFALIDDDALYLKADALNRPEFTARGCAAFRPFKEKPTQSMDYYQPPAEVLEDPELLCAWARRSIEAARRARAGERNTPAGKTRRRRG